jgi:hypothetical protein
MSKKLRKFLEQIQSQNTENIDPIELEQRTKKAIETMEQARVQNQVREFLAIMGLQ